MTAKLNHSSNVSIIHDEPPLLRLDCLPYDVLLHVVAYLDFLDIQSLQSVRILSSAHQEVP